MTQNSFEMNRFMAPPTHSKEGYFYYTSSEISQPKYISCTAMRCIYAGFMNHISKTARLRKMCWRFKNQDPQERKKRWTCSAFSQWQKLHRIQDSTCERVRPVKCNQTIVRPEVQVYFPFREEFNLQNGAIFKRDRVLIPFQAREQLKKRLHYSHIGMHVCLDPAQKAFYWPSLYKEIEEYISKCQVCNIYHLSAGTTERTNDSASITIQVMVVHMADCFDFPGEKISCDHWPLLQRKEKQKTRWKRQSVSCWSH